MWSFLVYALWFPLVQLSIEDKERNQPPLFVPSEEWQEVPTGQNIPPGLRVRLNLQTGSKEAKLMSLEDKDETESNLGIIVPTEHASHPSTRATDEQVAPFTSEHVAEQMKNDTSSLKHKFRSYEELKSEFEAINAQIKTDYELMTDIVRELKMMPAQESHLLTLLEDLAYLLHQVDNGRVFAEEGGLTMLSDFVDHPSLEVKQSALIAMSAAMQGNTVAKVIALQNGTLEKLHTLLNWSTQLPTPNTSALRLIQRSVGSIGALLRNFPAAQRYFFGNSNSKNHLSPLGFVLLSHAFDFTLSANETNLSVDTRVRILTLLSDLARERLSAKERSENPQDQSGQKMWTLYSSFPFESGLIDAGWCERLRNTLHTDMHFREDVASGVNHDRREKLLHCLLYMHPICEHMLVLRTSPDNSSVIADLVRLEEEYAAMASTVPDTRATGADRSKSNNEDDVDEMQGLAHEMLSLITTLLELQRNLTHYRSQHDPAEL